MSSTPKFSVVIPVYNNEAYVADTIRSAIQQEYSPHEIIVIDDGSTDQSAKIVQEFGSKVRFFQQTNQGCAIARNLGVRQSSGDYIAFLDSDDIWMPWTLKLVSEVIEKHPNLSMLATSFFHFPGGDLPDFPSEVRNDLQFTFYPDVLAFGSVAGTCVLVVRRDVFEEAGGFVEQNMNGTDAEFNLRAATQPGFVKITSPPMLAYRQHESNVTRNLAKCWEGHTYMIAQEKAKQYPGGSCRRRDRIAFITAQTRPLSCRATSLGEHRFGMRIYRETLAWNVRLGRMKYLFGFPSLVLVNWLRQSRETPKGSL